MREIPQMSDAILIHDQKGGFVSDGIEWFTDGKCSRVEIYGGGERVSTLNRGCLDYIKGRGPFHGYTTSTYRDGSIIVSKWQGEATVSEWKEEGSEKVLVIRSGKGTNIFVAGTGRFKGIEGRGAFSYTTVTPRWVVAEEDFEYTLP